MSAIIGAVVSALTGIGALFWVVGGAVFICGLPSALVSSFVHGEVSYAQDREDYRQAMAEIHAEEHEAAEDARIDRLIEAPGTRTNVYNDNRQVRIYEARR
jgi:uncharacterized membrane protein